jgi:hypothetical protein
MDQQGMRLLTVFGNFTDQFSQTELRLSHATAGLSTVVDTVQVPILQPGEEGDINVNFQAPGEFFL